MGFAPQTSEPMDRRGYGTVGLMAIIVWEIKMDKIL
jgi:hypothetical protein